MLRQAAIQGSRDADERAITRLESNRKNVDLLADSSAQQVFN